MNDHRCLFVAGPESNGNRFLVRFLVDGGYWGHGAQNQPIDGPPPTYPVILPDPLPKRLAFYRSYPHGGTWTRLGLVVRQLQRAGYSVTVLVPLRDQGIVERSQVCRGHVETIQQARWHIRRAYRLIFSGIAATGVEFHVVPYTRLATWHYREWLADVLELPRIPTLSFVDGNAAYE